MRARTVRSLTLLLACLAPLCAPASERVTFYPDWFPGPQFAGLYVALDTGLFAEAGLTVELSTFAFGRNVPALIDATPAVCGLGAIEGYIFLQQRARGQPLVALAAMFQESPAGFMAVAPTPLATARDFAGRRIGVHKFADPLFRWFVRRAGLDATAATMVFTDDDVGRLTRGEFAVMQGYATEEFIRLRAVVGDRARFLSFRELGFDSYSEIVFTTVPQLARHSGTLRRFQLAVRRGWERAFADPALAVAAIQRHLPTTATAPAPDAAHLQASLTALRAFVTPAAAPPLAPMSPDKWRRMQEIAVEMGLISRAEPPEDFLVKLVP